jgi:hypothetical protein
MYLYVRKSCMIFKIVLASIAFLAAIIALLGTSQNSLLLTQETSSWASSWPWFLHSSPLLRRSMHRRRPLFPTSFSVAGGSNSAVRAGPRHVCSCPMSRHWQA